MHTIENVKVKVEVVVVVVFNEGENILFTFGESVRQSPGLCDSHLSFRRELLNVLQQSSAYCSTAFFRLFLVLRLIHSAHSVQTGLPVSFVATINVQML